MADDPRFDIVYNNDTVGVAAFSQRWAALTKLDVDIDTIRTWDRRLPRDKRILVPVDVQAYVVPTAGAEATVAIAGGASDPEPFAAGAAPPSGVHLHWAMPDALMRGSHVEGATSITMPALPDRWVVVRTLLPVGGRLVHTRGWVVDAVKGSVTPLTDYSGTTLDAADGVQPYSPLDGTSGGTLLWSATYEGARNRFALHDDLADVPKLETVAPQGFHAGRACYTVAGWWSTEANDPLASARSRPELQARVAGFGWHISPEAPDDADTPDDPRLTRLRETSGLSSPKSTTPVHQYDKYSEHSTAYSEIAPLVASPVAEASAHYIGVGSTRYHSLLHGSVLGVPITGVLTAADDRPPSGGISTAIGLDLDDVTAALATPGFGASPSQRQSAERLMAAFTSGMLARITTPDGIRDIEEREHADGFWSFAGAPLAKAVDDRLRAEDSLPFNPTTVGRKGRGAMATTPKTKAVEDLLESEVAWEDKYSDKYVRVGSGSSKRSKRSRAAGSAAAAAEHTRAVTDGRQAGAKAVPAGTADRRGARGQAERSPPRRRAVRPPGAAVPLAGRVPTGLPGRARPGADPADTRQRGDPRRGTDGRPRGRHARSLFGPVAGPGRPARNAVEGPRRAHRGRTCPPLRRRDDLRRIGRRGAPEGDPTPACGRDVMVGRVGVERRLGDAVVGRTGQLLVSRRRRAVAGRRHHMASAVGAAVRGVEGPRPRARHARRVGPRRPRSRRRRGATRARRSIGRSPDAARSRPVSPSRWARR